MYNNSALLLAAEMGHSDIVKYLGDKGANLDLQGMFSSSGYFVYLMICIYSGREGKSALIWAAYKGHFGVIKYLVDKKVKLDLQGIFFLPGSLLSFIQSICSDMLDNSALLLAAELGHSDIVKYLGDKEANLDLQGMFSFLGICLPLPTLFVQIQMDNLQLLWLHLKAILIL